MKTLSILVGEDEIRHRYTVTTRRIKSLRTRLLKILSPGIAVDYVIDDKASHQTFRKLLSFFPIPLLACLIGNNFLNASAI